MATKEFTIAEVSAHNTRDDLYMIIDDNVYDLTKFAAEVSNFIKHKILEISVIDLNFLRIFPKFSKTSIQVCKNILIQ